MAKDFERYAKDHYLPAVKNHEADDILVLAGLRYIATRRVMGLDGALREIFTTRYTAKIGRAIDDACLDALLATAEAPLSNARFLAQVATLPRPLPTSPLAEGALLKQASVAAEAMLQELSGSLEAKQQRKLVRLLMRLTKVKPPLPIAFWKQANRAERRTAVNRWRKQVRAKGFDVTAAVADDEADRILKEVVARIGFGKADRLFERQKYARALEAFEAVAQAFGDTPYAPRARKRAKAMRADARIMAEVRKINANRQCERRLEAARALALRGDTDEAEKRYQRILRDHPGCPCVDAARTELAKLSQLSQ